MSIHFGEQFRDACEPATNDESRFPTGEAEALHTKLTLHVLHGLSESAPLGVVHAQDTSLLASADPCRGVC